MTLQCRKGTWAAVNSCTDQITVTFIADRRVRTHNFDPVHLHHRGYHSADITTQAANDDSECQGTDPNANTDYIAWLANNAGAVASDDCSEPVTWTNNAATATWSGGCLNTITVIFTAEDDCGNSATTQATFTIEDTTPPAITGGADGSTECTGTDPAQNAAYIAWRDNFGGVTATDICGTADMSYTEGTWAAVNSCTDQITVTFIATDECGLTTSTQFTFTIEDTTPPDITTQAANDDSECQGTDPNANTDYIAWLANNAGAVASDDCSEPVTWTNNAATATWSGGCLNTITVIFTAEDDCGNSATTQATFTIEDTTPPDITHSGSQR
jgi:large repetitive protein